MLPMCSLVVKYLDLVLIIVFTAMGYYMYLRKPRGSVCRELFAYQGVILILFNALSFLIILVHEYSASSSVTTTDAAASAAAEQQTLTLMDQLEKSVSQYLPSWLGFHVVFTLGLYALLMIFMYILLLSLYKNTNRLLWNAVFLLLSIGFIVLWRLDEESARHQVYWIGVGFLVLNIIMLIFRGRWVWRIPAWVFLVFSVVFILLPFAFPNAAYGALNWVAIGPVSFQPSEFVKVTFAFFLAVLYTTSDKKHAILTALFSSAFLAVVLLVQRDLGTLLIFCILVWMMTYDYLGKAYVLWGGALLVAAAGFAAYKVFGHVQVRFQIWLDPWEDVEGNGYQIVQSLFAISNGGWFGKGLYQGIVSYLPARTTDMIFAVIVNEFGGVFSIVLLLLYLLMFLFDMETGRRERNLFRRNLLYSFGILFLSQTFIIVGGVIKLIPLTGVTLPFISYGGSSLVSNFITIGIIEAVIRLYRIDKEEVRARARQEYEQQSKIDAFNFDEPF